MADSAGALVEAMNASAPYNDPKQADIILQTSDNVKFYVYKLLLSLVSPVFKDMFTLPQPESESSAAAASPYPIIPVAEDSESLSQILAWCDPRLLPSTGTLEEMQVVLEIAEKYAMDSVIKRVGDMIAYGLATLCPSGAGSVRAYAVAVRYRHIPLAHKAARWSLDAKWEDLMAEESPELMHIPASALHRLQQYRIACGAVAKKLTQDWAWIPDATGVVSECTLCASGVPPRHWAKWWVQYMAIAGEELSRNPSGTMITPDLALIPLAHMGSCSDCGRTMGDTYRALLRFNKNFALQVNRAVGEVPFAVLQL